MNRREAERFLTALHALRADGRPAASAVVVRVHGSAYRREGTRMLIRPDGTYECALSGGCLEPAVADAAARVIESGTPALLTYDLADESVWGLNLGCGGAVDVLIERLDDDEATTAWLSALARGEAAVLMTSLGGASGRRVRLASGVSIGRLSDPSIDRDADERAHAMLSTEPAVSVAERLGHADLFFEVNAPAPHLVIFGAGQDAVPLSRQAWGLGFDVTVVDARASYLREDLFPDVRLVLTSFDDMAGEAILPGSAVVVMNHHVDRDRASLRCALGSEAAYIGVLGPRARFLQLVRGLESEGMRVSAEALARVHSPVGLALGAETPEEVALSILAEVLAVRRGFEGGSLNGSTSQLHRPAAIRSFARS
jgi:xanthine/CO dehydrogenase XdhC/CoxF family maturation factor